mmetsp:Transcript_9127/g.16329  ORF Transcript_9127/g.16329 Transcript_9127/m.16329 type:complete len:82 (-) Transcript_9127:167-412(-)
MKKKSHILLSAGYTLEQIATASIQVDNVRKMRADSLKNQGLMDRTKSVLANTGKLPKDLFSGVANFISVKPTKTSIAARSA